MVSVISSGRKYDYPDKTKELVMINKEIRNGFSKIAKELKINKSKLIQEIYKKIIIDYQTGLLKSHDRNITISVQRRSVSKR